MVELRNVHKSFKTRKGHKQVLKDISFIAEPGEIYGLLGPNGAGKTTTLRIIATLLKADSGEVWVDGLNTALEGRKVWDKVGLLTGDMKLSGNLSPREMLKFFSDLNHIPKEISKKRIKELCEYLDMKDFLDRPIEKLSAGMKQKTSIAVSIVHDPDIIIFDEPTSNLDVLAVKVVVDFLHDASKQGKTVLLSTHVLSEAEKLCTRIGIILEGELIMNGTKEEILASYNSSSLEDVFFSLAKDRGLVI